MANTPDEFPAFTNLYMGRKKSRKINLDVSLMSDLYYSFRFRDLSKEAIMALAEGMLY